MDDKKIIEIRFGVEGGSSIEKNSGLDIKNQLMAIAKEISDKKLLTVKFNVDTQHISEQLKKINLDINSITKNTEINVGGVRNSSKILSEQKEINRQLKEEEKLRKQIEKALKQEVEYKNKALSREVSYEKQVANITAFIDRNEDLIKSEKKLIPQLDAVRKLLTQDFDKSWDADTFKQKLTELKKAGLDLEIAFNKSGASAGKFGLKLKEAFNSKVVQSLAYALVGVASRALRQVYQNVVALDGAVTDLQIATGKTREQTKELVAEYSKLAKQLGTTTLEVAKSADTWLRQGYSIAEANKLITDSTMLSKLGQIGSAEAAKALTSAMKGYKVSVEDAMGIVDKFTAVDMRAAVSAGNIATAMAETAASANIAGISMDKLIGYISTVAEVTQDGAESVGTFYKTMFARMGNVKAGVFVDDSTGESLNDVEKVLGKLGIKLRDNQGEFREYGNVLDEVGAKWVSFNGVQQKAIATAFAGKLVPVRTEMCA